MLFIIRGYSDDETIKANQRAIALAEKTGNLRQLFNPLLARGISAVINGDLRAASHFADRAIELAHRESRPSVLGRGHLLQMMVRFHLGDFVAAETHFTQELEFIHHPSFRRIPAAVIAVFSYGAWNAWMMGLSDVARERDVLMLSAVNANNPYEVAFSAHLEALAANALVLAEKHQFVGLAPVCKSILGRVRAELGRRSEGVGLLRAGIAGSLEMGEGLFAAHWTPSLARAQELAGAIEDALETAEQALKANPGDICRSETLRFRGELRVKLGQTKLAEIDFREAIAFAQTIGAKAWELRVATSLARLLQEDGRRDEARRTLAEIYNRFTQGFDSADLADAKGLLDELK
jgi:tetratricopeptide (TPR) repeat protein